MKGIKKMSDFVIENEFDDSEMEYRKELLSEEPLRDILSRLCEENDVELPSKLRITCPENTDPDSLAKQIVSEIKTIIKTAERGIKASLNEGNELDFSSGVLYNTENNKIYIKVYVSFEEYGKDVCYHGDLDDLDKKINQILKNKSKEYPGLKYEGIVSWKQYYGSALTYFGLIKNTRTDKYAKELILNDDEFWEEYGDLLE
jgi:hypothetical protein